MKQIPDNTLAHYALLPQCQLLNMGTCNTQLFAKNIQAYRGTLDGSTPAKKCQPLPDSEAIQFYLFNHLASIVRSRFTAHEVLPDWARDVMRVYKDILGNQGVRLTVYMGLITTRESRHMGSKDSAWWENSIVKPYGKPCYSFHSKIKGKSSGSVVESLMGSPPAVEVGKFYNAIQTMFFDGPFSSSYGGPPWGEITKCLCQFLDGKTTQEMMIDTAYTLAHNNGPMFNKGMVYDHYGPELKKILDVQRSGQIPQYVIEYGDKHLTKEQDKVFTAAVYALPGEFTKYVDWYEVEKLGALGEYPVEKAQQDKKYGKGGMSKVLVDFDGHKAKQIGVFQIAPGVSVPILERIPA
jgi:hypothetical protein